MNAESPAEAVDRTKEQTKLSRDLLARLFLWQFLSIVFGLAVVLLNLRQEWVLWQQVLAFWMAKDLMTGAIGLIIPEIRGWAERVIWRNNRGLSAFWCAVHIHPWLVPAFFPALHDVRFAMWLHGGCVASAIVAHRLPDRFRGPCAAFLAGMTALLATQRGVPAGFGWMAFVYPANCILCWWLPARNAGRRDVS